MAWRSTAQLKIAPVILLAAHQRDALPRIPAFQPVGPGAHGMLIEAVCGQILALQQVRRQNAHGQVIQHGDVGRGKLNLQSEVVRHADGGDILVVGGVFRGVGWVHNGLQRELGVRRRQLDAVVKIHVAAQVEGVGVGRLVELPPLGHIRNHPVILAVRRQPGKEQKVDFAVLIQRRVDGCIIAAAVDQGFGGILRRGLPAGRQAHRQQCGQKKC